MAIIKRSCLALALAFLSSTVHGQTSINYDTCSFTEDERNNSGQENPNTLDDNREGSQRRTYGNLCAGSDPIDNSANPSTFDIASRQGDPFRRFCDLIDRFPNIQALLATGNSPHTIFAPTDAAFAKIDGLVDRVNEQRLLELHILPQARLARDLRCGQTYRTVNTNQDRRNNQRSATRCISAARSQQLGPGNVVNGLKPTIGVPNNIFNAQEFESQRNFVLTVNPSAASNADDRDLFSQDVIACNGVIHVVDEVLLPGNNGFATGSGVYYGPGNGLYGVGGGPGQTYYGGAGPAPAYYGIIPPPRARPPRGYVGFKGGKGGRGFKGGKARFYNGGYYGARRRPPQQAYYNGFFRKLQQEANNGMSDSEFFGTDELTAEGASGETKDRKQRLEAYLSADGNVEV